MIFTGEHYILQSGRTLYSNCGILGLGPDVQDGVSEGYDGWFEESEQPLIKEEREEIATEMIQRWMQWRDFYESSGSVEETVS